MGKFCCRLCGCDRYSTIFNVRIPIVGNMMEEPYSAGDREDILHSLEPVWCESCGTVQLKETINIDLYGEYEFTMSYTKEFDKYTDSFVKNLEKYGEKIGQKKVIEIGSNTGYLLKKFQGNGWETVGVEPAKKLAKQAIDTGIETYVGCFGKDTVDEVIEKYGSFSIVILRHVLEHIDDIHGILSAIRKILAQNGILVIEVPYLLEIIRKRAFYSFYHEHIMYFSIESMRKLLALEGFYISNIEENKSEGGGSFLVYAMKGTVRRETRLVNQYMELEKNEITGASFNDLRLAIDEKKTWIREKIKYLHEEGKKVAAWGAGQRGCVLINLCGLTAKDIEYVVDMNKNYQWKYIPGTDIKVVPPEFHKENPSDLILIFATGYAESIISENAEYILNGGMFEVV